MRQIAETLIGSVPPLQHVLIAGPTAAGKSSLALALAERQGGTVVNADALQVFANWRVLTARPTEADTARALHALYGHVPADAEYSVGHWLGDVGQLLATGQRLIIVGGTGLNFMALTEGLAAIPAVPATIRAEADALLSSGGLAAMLAGLDAETAQRIDTANPARVQRAWEVRQATGRGLADWQRDTGPPLLALHDVTALALMADSDWLGTRIDRRFEAMIDAGGLQEARAALPGWDPARPSSKAIGAPELIAHLRGETTLKEAISLAKIASRQYAKRQRTWLRARMKNWQHVDLSGG